MVIQDLNALNIFFHAVEIRRWCFSSPRGTMRGPRGKTPFPAPRSHRSRNLVRITSCVNSCIVRDNHRNMTECSISSCLERSQVNVRVSWSTTSKNQRDSLALGVRLRSLCPRSDPIRSWISRQDVRLLLLERLWPLSGRTPI